MRSAHETGYSVVLALSTRSLTCEERKRCEKESSRASQPE